MLKNCGRGCFVHHCFRCPKLLLILVNQRKSMAKYETTRNGERETLWETEEPASDVGN